MSKIRLIVVDRTRSPFLRDGELFYLKRIQRYMQVEWVEIRPTKIGKAKPVEILAMEGKKIAQKIEKKDYLVSLDRSGYQHDSKSLAAWLNNIAQGSWNRISFVIGGPLGLSAEILQRSREVLSLSRLTMTHEMSRLFLLEQIYRAFTILRGGKYHK